MKICTKSNKQLNNGGFLSLFMLLLIAASAIGFGLFSYNIYNNSKRPPEKIPVQPPVALPSIPPLTTQTLPTGQQTSLTIPTEQKNLTSPPPQDQTPPTYVQIQPSPPSIFQYQPTPTPSPTSVSLPITTTTVSTPLIEVATPPQPTVEPTPTPKPLLSLFSIRSSQPSYLSYANPDSNNLEILLPYQSLSRGCTYTAYVYLQDNGIVDGGVDLTLQYDPGVLSIGTISPVVTAKDNGKIITSLSFHSVLPAEKIKLLTIPFTINSTASLYNSRFYFQFDPNNKDNHSDSNLVDYNNVLNDQLQEVYDAYFTINNNPCP